MAEAETATPVITRLPAGLFYEPLTWRHLREFPDPRSGWERFSDARLRFIPMHGYALREAATGALKAAGGVFWLDRFAKGPEAMFAMAEDFRSERTAGGPQGSQRSRWVHRKAVHLLAEAHRAAPLIFARADSEIPKARRWIEALGFTPSDGDLWVHGVVSGGRVIGGLVPCE